MSDRWEYKLIYWSFSTKFEGELGTYPSGESKRKQFWRVQLQSRESGKEPDDRLSYSNFGEDLGADTVKIQDLLNEFGAQGWELVSETVLDTTLVSDQNGWSKAGTPIEIRWILKRKVEEASIGL
jgi:hypothetical protein